MFQYFVLQFVFEKQTFDVGNHGSVKELILNYNLVFITTVFIYFWPNRSLFLDKDCCPTHYKLTA